MVVLNVVTGAAVRLSDSGLGCPDWPTCSQHHLTPAAAPAPAGRIRQSGGGVRAGHRLPGDRGGLVPPAGRPATTCGGCPAGLIVGVIGEAVLGAFVVYTKLNAYVVMTHFMVGMALLAAAVILTLEAGHRRGGEPWWSHRLPWG